MATHVQSSLQQKVYELLTADATLMALVTGVYDSLPDNLTYPYVTVGDDRLQDWGSHTHSGFQGTVGVHVWSQYAGRGEAKSIMNRVYTLLHNIDLSITSFPTITFRCGLSEVVKDPDGRTYHGIMQFNFMLGGNN